MNDREKKYFVRNIRFCIGCNVNRNFSDNDICYECGHKTSFNEQRDIYRRALPELCKSCKINFGKDLLICKSCRLDRYLYCLCLDNNKVNKFKNREVVF